MRIEGTRKQTPGGPLPSGSANLMGKEEERFVWQVLAPRLLQPSKLAFIQALLEHGRPLALRELAEAAGITEEHARHQCKSMQEAGVLEVVSVVDRADGEEPFYFFPKPPEPASSPPPAPSA